MARIRTVKPGYWTDEELATVSETAFLLGIALLNYSDDEGYFKANPALVKAACFPLRETSVTVPVALQELSAIGYIVLGKGQDGKAVGRVAHFDKHQRVNKPTPSTLKAGFEPNQEPVTEHSGSPTGILPEPSTTEKEEEGNRKRNKERKTPTEAVASDPPGGSLIPELVSEPEVGKVLQPYQEVEAVFKGVSARLETPEPIPDEVRRYLGASSAVRKLIAKYGIPGSIDLACYAMTHSPGCGWARIWEANASFANQMSKGVASSFKNGRTGTTVGQKLAALGGSQ